MYAMFLLSILGPADNAPTFLPMKAIFIVLAVGGGPMILHAVLYVFYYVWQNIYNAIRAWQGKYVYDIIGIDEFWPLNLIKQARRKQETEKMIEQAKHRASVCEMLNSNTEILSGSFEHYGLTLRSIRVHPYDDEYACDLEIEADNGKALSDDVYIHVHLLDDQEVETESLDIIIEAEDFSGYEVVENYDFSISSDSLPTHMKVYVDKNW